MKIAKNSKNLIKFRPELFWDVDPATIDPEKHAKYIIERILDFGYDNEVKWMSTFYPRDIINDTIRESKVVDDKSKSLWSLVF